MEEEEQWDAEKWEQEDEEERVEEERMVDECEDDWGPDLHGGLGLALCMHRKADLDSDDVGCWVTEMRRWGVILFCYSNLICYLANTDDDSLTWVFETCI